VSDGRPSMMFLSVYFTVSYGCRFLPFTIASVFHLYFYIPREDAIIRTECPVKGGTIDQDVARGSICDETYEKRRIDIDLESLVYFFSSLFVCIFSHASSS
jgi:hypothetical protein